MPLLKSIWTKSPKIIESLDSRFPKQFYDDIKIIEDSISLNASHTSYEPFTVHLGEDILTIPKRIYCNESQLDRVNSLSPVQQVIFYSFFSRHYDGYVRERCVVPIIESHESFAIPYIIELLGEYVVEILQLIEDNKHKINKSHLKSYILENPEHYKKTKHRIYSYWDCYYRSKYPKYRSSVTKKGLCHLDYPGIKMIKFISQVMNT